MMHSVNTAATQKHDAVVFLQQEATRKITATIIL
jgi:hypothetical protein